MTFLFRDNDGTEDNVTLPGSFEQVVDQRRRFVSSQTSEDIIDCGFLDMANLH